MEKLYNHQEAEKAARELWEGQNTYHRSQSSGPLYSIDTPPPTVSGSLHIGHIFSYTQTDILARFKRMSGFSVFYPFGFDDNGLPTEKFVEKKHNIIAHNLSRSEFIALCLKETDVVEKQFEDLWKRMGLSADWSSIYSTISPSTRKISQESFIRLYKKGHIYRKNEPALYCTTCRTSVAQAELDDKEVPSHFNDIVFKDSKGNELIIGTTRPELLPSCVALLYNPADPRYQHLQGTTATVPLFNTQVPVIADDAVAIDKGTGLVMCCTFGDKTDIVWFKKYKLPFKQSIGLDGKWVASTGPLAGLRVQAAREKVLEVLKEQGLLKHQRAITHAVNVHERCKREIEFLILPQWFLSILPHKQTFIDLADQIAWYPAFMKARYKNWVENVSWDWCLSRQRFFGIPFPVWHCAQCNEIILAPYNQLPLDPQETSYQGSCPKCSSKEIVPDTDVMDTWNTSSLTPYLCQYLLEPEVSPFENTKSSFLPMSMRPQAHDIIRTWAFDTIIKTWMHHETIPWNNIVISGHVLSDAKEKLSKSKENASSTPEHLLATYPADVIRYWTASGSLGYDVPFSENQLRIGQRLITKLWNAFRFIHEHTQQVEQLEPSSLGTINEWILDSVSKTFTAYQNSLKQHEFGQALDQIEKFFWKELCDNYLELVKDQLFNPQSYDPSLVKATQWTLYHTGLRILQMYAPYLPHITETLYQTMYRVREEAPSVHLTQWDAYQKEYTFTSSYQTMHTVIDVIDIVRKLKTEKQLSLKTELASLTMHGTQEKIDALKSQEQVIKGITHAKYIIYYQNAGPNPSLEHKEDGWHADIPVP